MEANLIMNAKLAVDITLGRYSGLDPTDRRITAFQYLIDNNLVSLLPSSWENVKGQMIEAGLCAEKKD